MNGDNTKAIVPENAHIFRDEADAAQSVHGKRLIPIGQGKHYFTLEDLKKKVDYLHEGEVFRSGLGTVAIENPIRRAEGRFIPLEELKKIRAYCQQQGYKMHLDGARIHLATAYSKVSLSEYASYFDTVYISLYKYLHAAGGAILCGDAKIIDQVAHQIKILGGTTFQTWGNTAVALHYLEGLEQRWEELIKRSEKLIAYLNEFKEIDISKVENGTNIYQFRLNSGLSLKKLAIYLNNEYNIWLGRADEAGIVKFAVNESLLRRPLNDIMKAWKAGINQAKA